MSNELYHHGILGQKWGVRRYQNPDGSYKKGAEGRYNDNNEPAREKIARSDNDSSVTRKVKDDYDKMTDDEFKRKYYVSKDVYKKRVDKYGDPYTHNSKVERTRKAYEKGLNSVTAKAEKRAGKIQADIDSFKGLEKGIFTKDGKMLLSPADVSQSVSALKATRDKEMAKAQNYMSKVQKDFAVSYDVTTGRYSVKHK